MFGVEKTIAAASWRILGAWEVTACQQKWPLVSRSATPSRQGRSTGARRSLDRGGQCVPCGLQSPRSSPGERAETAMAGWSWQVTDVAGCGCSRLATRRSMLGRATAARHGVTPGQAASPTRRPVTPANCQGANACSHVTATWQPSISRAMATVQLRRRRGTGGGLRNGRGSLDPALLGMPGKRTGHTLNRSSDLWRFHGPVPKPRVQCTVVKVACRLGPETTFGEGRRPTMSKLSTRATIVVDTVPGAVDGELKLIPCTPRDLGKVPQLSSCLTPRDRIVGKGLSHGGCFGAGRDGADSDGTSY